MTPSHQFPLGITMSLGRRLELLEFAKRTNTWIFEDDYDSEYRYRERPCPALQSLDTAGRVIYVGTFSKVLFPSLRLGYLVVPPKTVDAFIAARNLYDRFSPLHEQRVVTDFITGGHFARHIRRMRLVYAERQEALLQAINSHALEFIRANPSNCGLHLIAWLRRHRGDQVVTRAAAAHGVGVQPLSLLSIKSTLSAGLLLGFGGMNPKQIRLGIKRLSVALAESALPCGHR